MNILITWDVFHPGPAAPQQANRQAFAETLRPALEALGHTVMVDEMRPAAWLNWARRGGRPGWVREWPEFAEAAVGFESPAWLEGAPRGAPRYNVRVHPLRYGGRAWSVHPRGSLLNPPEESYALIKRIDGFACDYPAPAERVADLANDAVFACQVSFDCSLIDAGAFLHPEDVMLGIREFAHAFDTLYVCPHPLEPSGPWPKAVLRAIPNAVLSPWPTYEALRRVRTVCTVSSSVGVEAERFGCETVWLLGHPSVSAPIADDVFRSPEFWKAVLP